MSASPQAVNDMPAAPSPAVLAERAAFSRDIHPLNLMPLWERALGLKPGTKCVPAFWRYADIRPHLLHASTRSEEHTSELQSH